MKIFLLLFLIPLTALAQHKATTVLQIRPSRVVIDPLKPKIDLPGEEEIIVARKTLEIAAHELNGDLSAEELALAVSDLKERITTNSKRETDFIEVTAEATTPEEAIRTSNAVSEAFIKHRKKIETQRAKETLAELEANLAAQSKQAEKDNKDLISLVKEFGIPLLDPVGDLKKLQAQIDFLNKAKPSQQLAIMAGMNFQINQLTEPYRVYRRDLEMVNFLRRKYGGQHPVLVTAQDQLKKSREEVSRSEKFFRESLRGAVISLKKWADLDPAELTLRQNNYRKAMERSAQSRDMRTEMLFRLQKTRKLLKWPRNPASIHERAE